MTAQPDPQLVREIARKHLAADAVTIDAAEIVAAARAHLGAGASADDLHTWSQALRDELDSVTITVVMSWPDEQPQDELEQLRTLTAGLRREWGVQAEHSTSAFPTRTEAVALELAASYSRLREPGCKPTPHHAVTRLVDDWHRVAESAPQQPERDGGGAK